MKISGYIYLLIDKRNGKKYIGKHIGSVKSYFTGGKIPKMIIKKYGKNIFNRIILEDNIKENSLLNEKEKYYIEKYNTFKCGYNLTNGGDGGGCWILKLSAEEKEVIANKKREKTKGIKFTEEHKKKLSESQKKKKLTEEHKKNISKAISGENHPWYGKKHSNETKEKISKSRKGIKNIKHSQWMLKNNPSSQPISVCGNVYKTIKEASEQLKLSRSSVKYRLKSESEKWKNWFKIKKSKKNEKCKKRI